VTSCAFSHNEYILYEGTNVPATYSLYMSTLALCLTPSTLETPCTSRTPLADNELPRDYYARTLLLHKIETCLPLLSLGAPLYTSGHRQSTFKSEENIPFLQKENQFLKRRRFKDVIQPSPGTYYGYRHGQCL
jgi:hypothetical protein